VNKIKPGSTYASAWRTFTLVAKIVIVDFVEPGILDEVI
jgi:hypothetical protein